jgi:hypothetical protein
VAVVIVAIAILFWPQRPPAPEPSAETKSPPSRERKPGLASERESAASPDTTPKAAATPPQAGEPKRFTVAIHVATFDGRDVVVRQEQGRSLDSPSSRIEAQVVPGQQESLLLATPPSLVAWTVVEIPDPVPERLEVRVPAADDPRLADVVLRAVDEETGEALPRAYLDPGPAAPDLQPLRADGEGRIRVPRAFQERMGARAVFRFGAVVAEREHLPRPWTTLDVAAQRADDWRRWDAEGALPIRLERLRGEVRRTTYRLVDESGRGRAGTLVTARYPITDTLYMPAPTTRTDANGAFEVLGSAVVALDVFEGPALLGTWIVVPSGDAGGPPPTITLPSLVHVRVRVQGADAKPTAWIHGVDLVLAAPEDRTGFARIDGKVEPGWKAMKPFEGSVLAVEGGPPYEIDVALPKGGAADLDLGIAGVSHRARVRAADAPALELDWSRLPEAPRERDRTTGWAPTREELDEMPAHLPEPSKGVAPAR